MTPLTFMIVGEDLSTRFSCLYSTNDGEDADAGAPSASVTMYEIESAILVDDEPSEVGICVCVPCHSCSIVDVDPKMSCVRYNSI